MSSTEANIPSDRFSPRHLHRAATLYYAQEATQAEVANQLGVSRATVSRMLSEARRQGIVRIEIVDPDTQGTDLARAVAEALGLQAVHLEAASAKRRDAPLSAPLAEAMREISLAPGQVLLVSSGRTVYEATKAALPPLPGVIVAPTIGGQEEPDPWFQTNEITRQVATAITGRPLFLYAPALPSPELHPQLMNEPSIRRVLELWQTASAAILGIGQPLLLRSSTPAHLAAAGGALNQAAGDISSRFFDHAGRPVVHPGDEWLIAPPLELLTRIPVTIGVAYGAEKVGAIATAARAGYVNRLVTDEATARALLDFAANA